MANINVNHDSYSIEGSPVDKALYERIDSNSYFFYKRIPKVFYAKAYDSKDHLIKECAFYKGFWFNEVKTYNKNGNINEIGYYTAIDTNSQLSPKKDSVWTYFNGTNKIVYQDLWDKGRFVKELIQRDTNELWKVDFLLNGRSEVLRITLRLLN
jgi:hypothetical protein